VIDNWDTVFIFFIL